MQSLLDVKKCTVKKRNPAQFKFIRMQCKNIKNSPIPYMLEGKYCTVKNLNLGQYPSSQMVSSLLFQNIDPDQ